jgi:uncharacterized protein YqhQ
MTKPSYGGQAVIEGVMMSGPKGKAIAVRNEDGKIVYKVEGRLPLGQRYPLLKLPLLRGIASFASSMVSGIKDLTWSAAQAGESEDEKLSRWDIFLSILVAMVIAMAVFVALPVFLGTWLHPYIGDFGRSLVEGLIRAGLFLGYVVLISRMEDIKRLFAYHGAEHKTINAYEAGADLTPEKVSGFSRIHTRCGTSFILMAMILMIIIFTFVGQTGALWRVVIKIALMPLVAGLAFELYRLPLLFPNNPLVKILVAPGLAMQRLTTREPDMAQLEIAIASLKAVPGFELAESPDAYASSPENGNPDLEKTLVIDIKNPAAEHE